MGYKGYKQIIVKTIANVFCKALEAPHGLPFLFVFASNPHFPLLTVNY